MTHLASVSFPSGMVSLIILCGLLAVAFQAGCGEGGKQLGADSPKSSKADADRPLLPNDCRAEETQSPQEPCPSPAELRRDVVAYVGTLSEKPGEITGRWKYNRHSYRPWSAESSGMAMKILHGEGELDDLPEAKRRELIELYQSWQDPEDGFFKDPLLSEEDKTSEYHPWKHVWFHLNLTMQSVLKDLGAEPLFPMPESYFHDFREKDLEEWLESLDWKDPYQNSGLWGYGLIKYRESEGLEGRQTDEICEKAFAFMENEILDPDSGLPDARGCEHPLISMAGLYSLLPAYRHAERPYPHPRRAIDSVLAMQDDSGGWGKGLCMHYDALWCLKVLSDQLEHGYRFEDIRSAANRLCAYLCREHRYDDGGFSFYPDHCVTKHMSIGISDPLDESDMLGTYMSWNAIKIIDELNQAKTETAER